MSAIIPCTTSLVYDYFHPDYRTRALSYTFTGIYIGGALASLSLYIIETSGWRAAYLVVGVSGLVIGVVCLLIIKEPTRNTFDQPKSSKLVNEEEERSEMNKFFSALCELSQNPACRYTSIGGILRNFGVYPIEYFMPKYYLVVYSDKKEYFVILSTIVIPICSVLSSIIYGTISDKYHSKGHYSILLYICIACSLLGIPTICASMLI